MDALKLDAFVYPTWSNPPRLIGDLTRRTATTASSSRRRPASLPSRSRWATRATTLPAGMTFFGRAWSEPTLLKLAYGYEQATHHRRAPSSTR